MSAYFGAAAEAAEAWRRQGAAQPLMHTDAYGRVCYCGSAARCSAARNVR